MSNSKPLLIFGATGNQGSALIDALLASQSKAQFQIVGVTRNPQSASAQKLQQKSPLIKIIQGSYDDLPGLFKTARGVTQQSIYGVFSVQAAIGGGATPVKEEAQGKALIDESINQGVKHFVQMSVDRGGDEKSWTNPTNVPHFASKHAIELHLRDFVMAVQGEKMAWTILRPTAFMENWSPGFPTKVFFAALRETLGDTPLQVIAARDIGVFAAKAFEAPIEYGGKAMALAGDDITFQQLDDTFKRITGHNSGATYGFVGKGLLWGVKELGVMMEWFRTDGYGADIGMLRQKHPELLDFGTWLETKSGWAKK